jgi:hypothetical protein
VNRSADQFRQRLGGDGMDMHPGAVRSRFQIVGSRVIARLGDPKFQDAFRRPFQGRIDRV